MVKLKKMIPKILEYEDNRVKVTAAAFAIPEIKAILDKYPSNADAYLTYVYGMVAPDSPYVNIPLEEKQDAIVYDVQATLGEFDYNDPILEEAIDNLQLKYEPPIVSLAIEMGQELLRFRNLLRKEDLDKENFRDRVALAKDIDKVASAYDKVKIQAENMLKASTKGGHELGGYE